MKIAIFHFMITKNNPAGSCVRRIVEAICDPDRLEIYAIKFDNPCNQEIEHKKIYSPTRPLVFMFFVFYLQATIRYCFSGSRRDNNLVVFTEARIPFGDIAYPHFCHRAYLRTFWKQNQVKGIRRILKWLNHKAHSISEGYIYPRVKRIIVPSHGLKRELLATYDLPEERIDVIHNPVDIDHFDVPDNFNKSELLIQNDLFDRSDIVGVFIALGDFERKGLDVLLKSMPDVDPRFKLLVVGGTRGLIDEYEAMCSALGLDRHVRFVGRHRDIRPFLWSSDVFVLPSMYEIFPLVSLEAAAAGLPLVTTKLYGVEEFMESGTTGFIVERNVASIQEGLNALIGLSDSERASLGKNARSAVRRFSLENFGRRWKEVLSYE